MSKVTLSDKSAFRKMMGVPSRRGVRKASNIANMSDIAEAIRKVAKERRIKKYEVRPWKRAIFLVYDSFEGQSFYHIPDDQLTQEDFERIVGMHGKTVRSPWLYRRLMSNADVKKHLQTDPKKNGKWMKYRVPSNRPFGIKGDFLIISTGFPK